MRNKLNRVIESIKTAVLNSPVEVLLSFCFCVLAIWHFKNGETQFEGLLFYFPVFFLISNMLNHLTEGTNKRFIYYLSLFIFLPFIGIKDVFSSPTYVVSLVVVQLVYFVSRKKKDNNDFMDDVLGYFIGLASAFFLSMVTFLLSISIYQSIRYIFEIWQTRESYAISYIFSCVFLFILPVLFLTLYKKDSSIIKAEKLFDILFNYVLTPALLIYAAILYLYFIKIVITWSLPKGGVAYIVVSFTAILFILKGFQVFLTRRFYNWFYNKASFVVMPALIMYWIGTYYRINQYGFTESRVYLVVVGLILTLMTLLFLSNKYGKYLYIASAAAVLLSVVTYIPGIKAKNIEEYSQQRRIDRGEVTEVEAYDKYSYISIESNKSVNIEGYKEIIPLNSYKNNSDLWFEFSNYGAKGDTFYLRNANDSILFKESAQTFFDNKLRKNAVALGDSIPASIYSDLLKLENDSTMLIFTYISLSRENANAPYKINSLNPGYYLKK